MAAFPGFHLQLRRFSHQRAELHESALGINQVMGIGAGGIAKVLDLSPIIFPFAIGSADANVFFIGSRQDGAFQLELLAVFAIANSQQLFSLADALAGHNRTAQGADANASNFGGALVFR